MSGRRRQGLSPSLFPFLAVLVCTLGTLILLLALVAQNATTAAQQQAQAKLQSKDEASDSARPRMTRAAVEDLLRQEEFRVNELVSVRDQQTADLEARRDELTHLEDHIARLRQQISQLNDEVGVATGELEVTSITESAINEIEAKINEEQQVIEALREETKDQSPRVVIVPHKGPNGTSRRPVYLECHADGIHVRPVFGNAVVVHAGAAPQGRHAHLSPRRVGDRHGDAFEPGVRGHRRVEVRQRDVSDRHASRPSVQVGRRRAVLALDRRLGPPVVVVNVVEGRSRSTVGLAGLGAESRQGWIFQQWPGIYPTISARLPAAVIWVIPVAMLSPRKWNWRSPNLNPVSFPSL